MPTTRYNADFYLAEYNLVIECDGAYWHIRRPDGPEKTARKTAALLKLGYNLLRFSDAPHEGSIGPHAKEIVIAKLAELTALALPAAP